MGLFRFIAANAGKLSFAAAFALVFLLVPLETLLQHNILSAAFILVFASTMACTARQALAGAKRASGQGAAAILFSALGIATLEVCGLVACGAAGLGLLSLLLPWALMQFLWEYGTSIVAMSLAAMLLSLKMMGCLSLRAVSDAVKN